jgi:hypothetical protein
MGVAEIAAAAAIVASFRALPAELPSQNPMTCCPIAIAVPAWPGPLGA